ncbi:hypothetical protein OAJ27_00460 [bacterium]|nr:hypothetical protein [bacterium]
MCLSRNFLRFSPNYSSCLSRHKGQFKCPGPIFEIPENPKFTPCNPKIIDNLSMSVSRLSETMENRHPLYTFQGLGFEIGGLNAEQNGSSPLTFSDFQLFINKAGQQFQTAVNRPWSIIKTCEPPEDLGCFMNAVTQINTSMENPPNLEIALNISEDTQPTHCYQWARNLIYAARKANTPVNMMSLDLTTPMDVTEHLKQLKRASLFGWPRSRVGIRAMTQESLNSPTFLRFAQKFPNDSIALPLGKLSDVTLVIRVLGWYGFMVPKECKDELKMFPTLFSSLAPPTH